MGSPGYFLDCIVNSRLVRSLQIFAMRKTRGGFDWMGRLPAFEIRMMPILVPIFQLTGCNNDPVCRYLRISSTAAENHADNVQATGAGGWGPNAQITISSNGDSVVSQDGAILQISSDDSQSAASLNNVGVAQQAAASESQVLDAAGTDVSNQQSGWAAAQGEGASAADATSSVDIPGADLGLPHRKH